MTVDPNKRIYMTNFGCFPVVRDDITDLLQMVLELEEAWVNGNQVFDVPVMRAVGAIAKEGARVRSLIWPEPSKGG